MPTTTAPGYSPTGSNTGQYDYMWHSGRWWRHTGGGSYVPSPTAPPQGASINPSFPAEPPPPGWWTEQMQGGQGAVPPGPGSPGYTSLPPGGTGTGGAPPPGATNADPELQQSVREAAYRRGLQRAGYKSGGAFGGFLKARSEPAFANFWAENALKAGRGEAPIEDYEGYVAGNVPSGSQPLYAGARQRFNQITGSRAPLASGLEDILGNITSANINQGEDLRGNLRNLAYAAARDQYGGWGANYLPSESRLNERFEDEYYANEAAGQNDPGRRGLDYREFLRRMFNIR